MSEPEVVLKGGRANAGAVVRIGDEVARPSYEQTPYVEHFLRFLHDEGVSEIPEPLASDARGRQRLRYIPGIAPKPPYPDWAFSDHLLRQVAKLQRRLHRSARSYSPLPESRWAVSAGDYFPPSAFDAAELLVCHNDLGMTNVIVDDRRPEPDLVGVIDFDYCRPVDPLFDIAVAIRHWAPFGDLDLTETRSSSIDRIGRFALFCDEHELDAGERERVVSLAIDFLDHARTNVAALAAEGAAAFQQLMANGYETTNRATVAWIGDNAHALRHA